ncbi:MAG TPA: nucleotidyltransferase domain-containing protein [Anaeromyxobacter sp.]
MPAGAESLRARLTEVLTRRSEVLEAYLFGSSATGMAQPHSDVDVAIYAARIPDEPFGYEATVAAELMSALSTDRVDVVVLNRAPPLLYHRVLRDGQRLFSRDLRATTAREGAALSRYCDWVAYAAKVESSATARIAFENGLRETIAWLEQNRPR